MVDEINKSEDNIDNEQLGQRLAASNQALAEMQAEHRQLLEEMEQLRRRAENLQRLREQQEHEEKEKKQHKQNIASTSKTLETDKSSQSALTSEGQTKERNEMKDETNISTDESDYIKEKLAEIEHLKAKFKRVQNMINTTELIENHINKKYTAVEKPAQELTTKQEKASRPIAIKPLTTSIPTDQMTLDNMPNTADLDSARTADEKEQLLLTMLNMFQDFSSDLKSQADNLRSERERIKELKESIIRSRKQSPK